MHLVLAALALLSAAPPAARLHTLPPGAYQVASITLTGGGSPTPGGGGGGATDGQLDFSAASQSGLLAFF